MKTSNRQISDSYLQKIIFSTILFGLFTLSLLVTAICLIMFCLIYGDLREVM